MGRRQWNNSVSFIYTGKLMTYVLSKQKYKYRGLYDERTDRQHNMVSDKWLIDCRMSDVFHFELAVWFAIFEVTMMLAFNWNLLALVCLIIIHVLVSVIKTSYWRLNLIMI